MYCFPVQLWFLAILWFRLGEGSEHTPDRTDIVSSSQNTNLIIFASVAAALLGVIGIVFLAQFAMQHPPAEDTESFRFIEAWIENTDANLRRDIGGSSGGVAREYCDAPVITASPSIAVRYATNLEIFSSRGTIITSSESPDGERCGTWLSESSGDGEHDVPRLPQIVGLEPFWDIDWDQFAMRRLLEISKST